MAFRAWGALSCVGSQLSSRKVGCRHHSAHCRVPGNVGLVDVLNQMAKKETFEAVIQAAGRGGAYVVVPLDVEEVFGSKRPKVKATFDGVPYRGTLVRMGGPDHILPILKSIREAIDKQVGSTVQVTVALDTEPRTVVIPEDLTTALAAAPAARDFFEQLSYTNRKEYVGWIEGAKRETTRASRIERTVSMLKDGRRSP